MPLFFLQLTGGGHLGESWDCSFDLGSLGVFFGGLDATTLSSSHLVRLRDGPGQGVAEVDGTGDTIHHAKIKLWGLTDSILPPGIHLYYLVSGQLGGLQPLVALRLQI